LIKFKAVSSLPINSFPNNLALEYPLYDFESPDCLPSLAIPFAIKHDPAIASLQFESVFRNEGPSVFVFP
jgi:hypothetical protein